MSSADGLPIAPLRRRLGAMAVNAGLGVVGVAAMSAAAVVVFEVGGRLPGRLRVANPRNCAVGESCGRMCSPTSKRTMSAMGLVGSVVARNCRSPGAKAMRIRKVDARTGGPISVRSALIGWLVPELWGTVLNRVFGPYEQPRLAAAQARLQALQPAVRDLQREHAGDQEAMQRALMELYKRNKVSPFASCSAMLPKMLAGQAPRLLTPQHRNLPDWIAGVAIVTEPDAQRGRRPHGRRGRRGRRGQSVRRIE